MEGIYIAGESVFEAVLSVEFLCFVVACSSRRLLCVWVRDGVLGGGVGRRRVCEWFG